MTRRRVPGQVRQADVNGPRYDLFLKRMWGTPPPEGFRGLPCAYCLEPIRPGCGEVEHIISPDDRPDLAQARSNVRPSHGGCYKCPDGGHSAKCRRSPVSHLDCNAIASQKRSPGELISGFVVPLAPWPPEFKAAAIERAQARDRAGTSSVTRREPRKPSATAFSAETPDFPKIQAGAGRVW